MNKKGALVLLGETLLGGAVALGALLRDTLAAGLAHQEDEEDAEEDHYETQILDSDLIGAYNHRTHRFDAGTDPYGWYDDD